MRGTARAVRCAAATLAATAAWSCGGSGGGETHGPFVRRGDTVTAAVDGFTLRVDLRGGRYDVSSAATGGADGRPIVVGASALAGLSDDTLFSTAGATLASVTTESIRDELGDGERLTVTRDLTAPGVRLIQHLDVYPAGPFLASDLTFENHSDTPRELGRLSPLRVDAGEGRAGVFVADDPATARVLDDGAAFFFDFDERVLPADGPVLSNYDACFHDLASGSTVLAGFVTIESGVPTIESRFDPARALGDGERRALTRFEARSLYVPAKPVAPGSAWTSERLVLDVASPSPFDALERWAERVARAQHVTRWIDRAPGNGIPNGWNSWSGGAGSGGYGTSIDEDLILANLDFMAANLAPFGQAYFQVDDGWQQRAGDWDANERFPHGMAWLAERIRERGLIPGLWIEPFLADETSAVLRTHPDWAAHTQTLDVLGIPDEKRVLDLSRGDVRDWISGVFARLHEWGYRWIKTDFTYHFFLARDLAERAPTLVESYRAGLRAIRAGAGDDTFHLNVAAVGPSFGLVDGSRMTLDNQPVWQGEGSPVAEQGIRPTAQAVARRYFLDGRVWVNHPDLIFFRSHTEPGFPPLTFGEALANVTFVGLTGGIVKVGDRALDMRPEWVDAIRRILPTQGHTARPTDLFARDVPEVWALPVETDWERWMVVGLFHWGANLDLTTNPYTPSPAGPRAVGADLAALGLDPAKRYLAYEFWSDTFLGEVGGRLEATLEPRSALAIALREVLGHPQLLSTNRHISQGATDLAGVRWDEASATLSGTVAAAPGTAFAPFEHVLTLHVPEGYGAASAVLDSAALGVAVEPSPPLVRVRFHADHPASIAWSVHFDHVPRS